MSTAPESFDVVVVGAGHAGTTVVAELIDAGFAGRVALLGDEGTLPYDRPPLSKGYLLGTAGEDGLLLRSAAYWQDASVHLALGCPVVRIEPGRRVVVRADGSEIGYGALVWTAGGSARGLGVEGALLPGVHALRTVADARRLRSAMRPEAGFVVVGGGFIGLEVAAALVTSGIRTSVLEAAPRLLARVTGDVVSRWFLHRHRRAGVDVRLSSAVSGIASRDGRVAGVTLAGGELLPADHVVVAVGLVPTVAPLIAAGAAGTDGVDVDAAGRTSLPDVYAAGDCARFPFAGHPAGVVRLESIQNAVDQAKAVARSIRGALASERSQPWFWSHQFDVRFRTVGIAAGHDATVVRGDPAGDAFSVAYLRDDRIIAVDTINHMKDYVGARKVVGHRVDPAVLADAGRGLTDAATAGAATVR